MNITNQQPLITSSKPFTLICMNEVSVSLSILNTHKTSIFIGGIFGAILAAFITLFQTPIYQAEMIVGPTQRTGVPSLSSMLPTVAADAPALQYFVERIDAAQSNDFTVFETRLTAPSTIQQINGDMIPSDTPQLWIKKNLQIRPVGLTQFRRVILKDTHKDKLVPILNTLYHLTDLSVRQDNKAKAERRMSYLSEQLKNTLNPAHRDAIIALIKEQEQTTMMASIDHEFAARVIEPAYILPKPVAPNWKILFPILIALGGFIGLIVGSIKKS